MIKYFLSIFLLMLTHSCYSSRTGSLPNGTYHFLDIAKKGYEQYQDIFINGKVIKQATHNHHDCNTRYQIIKQILDCYKRSFTMLDIGAAQGYYSFRAAYEYPKSVFVMIEGNNQPYPLIGTQLLDLCFCNDQLNNIIFLNNVIRIKDLQRLSECEHFDVVLALNILHWLGKRWRNAADAILNMGDNIIVETPPQEPHVGISENARRKEIEDYLLEHEAESIGVVKRHTSHTQTHLYLIRANKNRLQRRSWIKPLEKQLDKFVIQSTLEEKKLIKYCDWPPEIQIISPWKPGINLMTFKMYHGVYPTKQNIKQAIIHLKDIPNNDWMPNNIIIQGNTAHMIDLYDPTHQNKGRFYSNKFLQRIFKMIDIDDPQKIEAFFWRFLVS